MKIELSHDILAKKIYDLVSAEDKMVSKMQTFIINRYAFYLDAKVLLDRQSLEYVAPYLNRIVLDKAQKSFIRKSKRAAFAKRIAINGSIALTIFVLFIYGVRAAGTYFDLSYILESKYLKHNFLKQEKNKIKADKEKAQKVFATKEMDLQDLANLDKNVLKQMILHYEDQGKKQDSTRQQRNLAQSSTISDLASEAFDQDDLKYAFQLAVKAYELNPDNKQAIELLEALCNPEEAIADMDTKSVQKLINQTRRKYKAGKLSKKEMKVIFTKDNTVVQERSKGVKKLVQTTKLNEEELAVTEEMERPYLLQQMQQQQKITGPVIDIIEQQPDLPKKPPVKTPTEETATSVPPPSPVPNINKVDCAGSKQYIDQWVPLKKNERFTIFGKFSSDGKLHFMFESRLPLMPTFDKVKFYNATGDSRSVTLADGPAPKGKKVYTVRLSSEDIALLKTQKINKISFQKLGGSSIMQQSAAGPRSSPRLPNNSFDLGLEDKTQGQLQTLSRCFL